MMERKQRERKKGFIIVTKDVHGGIDRQKIHRKKFYNNDREKTKREKTKREKTKREKTKREKKKFYNIDQGCA